MYNKFKIKIKEPLFSKVFEEYKDKNNEGEGSKEKRGNLFPKEVIEKMPDKKIKETCKEFNFNYRNENPVACILLLRRLVPLSIIKKFLMENLEDEIKNNKNEFLGTSALVDKSNRFVEPRLQGDVDGARTQLDSSQHLFSVSMTMTDAGDIGGKVRAFLDSLFEE